MEMTKEIMVSVIIPVYNVEAYLEKCLDSLVTQTYKDFEIILIDDGSTDNSGRICDEYSNIDDRIAVLHKTNGGPSSARNMGLKHAKGKYVLFIDSDDFVDNDYIQVLIKNINGFDAISCGDRTIVEGKIIKTTALKTQSYLGNDRIKDAYIQGEIKNSFYGPCAIMYSREKIKDLKFDENLPVGEDIVFNLNFLQMATSVATLEYVGYNIRSHADSTTHKLALEYTRLYEHSYHTIANEINRAKVRWGFDEKLLLEKQKKDTIMRFYHETTNLFRPGTPYSAKQIKKRIALIHQDQKFLETIKQSSFDGLTRSEKISKICVSMNVPIITYWIIKMVLLLKHQLK